MWLGSLAESFPTQPGQSFWLQLLNSFELMFSISQKKFPSQQLWLQLFLWSFLVIPCSVILNAPARLPKKLCICFSSEKKSQHDDVCWRQKSKWTSRDSHDYTCKVFLQCYIHNSKWPHLSETIKVSNQSVGWSRFPFLKSAFIERKRRHFKRDQEGKTQSHHYFSSSPNHLFKHLLERFSFQVPEIAQQNGHVFWVAYVTQWLNTHNTQPSIEHGLDRFLKPSWHSN